MNRIFIGVDERQPVAYHTLAQSIMDNCSDPVAITPLYKKMLPVEIRSGLTEFTYSRYLVPYLCNYEGRALFMDADMLVMGDLKKLFEADLEDCGVFVAPVTRRFERVSLMLFNNPYCKKLTPEYINTKVPQEIEDWSEKVGTLHPAFNYTIPYDEHPECDPVVVHYTQGIPCFTETENCEYAQEWRDCSQIAMSTVSWEEIMGQSVHKKEMA